MKHLKQIVKEIIMEYDAYYFYSMDADVINHELRVLVSILPLGCRNKENIKTFILKFLEN